MLILPYNEQNENEIFKNPVKHPRSCYNVHESTESCTDTWGKVNDVLAHSGPNRILHLFCFEIPSDSFIAFVVIPLRPSSAAKIAETGCPQSDSYNTMGSGRHPGDRPQSSPQNHKKPTEATTSGDLSQSVIYGIAPPPFFFFFFYESPNPSPVS